VNDLCALLSCAKVGPSAQNHPDERLSRLAGVVLTKLKQPDQHLEEVIKSYRFLPMPQGPGETQKVAQLLSCLYGDFLTLTGIEYDGKMSMIVAQSASSITIKDVDSQVVLELELEQAKPKLHRLKWDEKTKDALEQLLKPKESCDLGRSLPYKYQIPTALEGLGISWEDSLAICEISSSNDEYQQFVESYFRHDAKFSDFHSELRPQMHSELTSTFLRQTPVVLQFVKIKWDERLAFVKSIDDKGKVVVQFVQDGQDREGSLSDFESVPFDPQRTSNLLEQVVTLPHQSRNDDSYHQDDHRNPSTPPHVSPASSTSSRGLHNNATAKLSAVVPFFVKRARAQNPKCEAVQEYCDCVGGDTPTELEQLLRELVCIVNGLFAEYQ